MRTPKSFVHVAGLSRPDSEFMHHWPIQSTQILSAYDAHRHELEAQLKHALPDACEDRVFNVDTFQGREEDVILVSLARTKGLGFMRDDRRVNVMLTR